MSDESEIVEARVPESIGVLSSASGEEVRGGQVGQVTRREVRIYGCEVISAKDEGRPLNKWTVAELRAYAEECGVDLSGAKSKEDILDAIAADASRAEG